MACPDQPSLDGLVRKLGISEKEVQAELGVFLEAHPKGSMSKAQFVSSCLAKEGGSEEQAIALFKVFDGDESGTMDFIEFMMASNATALRCSNTSLV